MLVTRGLTKNFGGLTAVNRVDFEIREGEIVAIIGPNGAGKTTFFNLISGFYRPSGGSINFLGREVTNWPVHRLARLGMARTFQTTHLFTDATVLDNLIVGYRAKTGMGLVDALLHTPRATREEKASREKAWEVLDFIGLANAAHRPVRSLSQEEAKRLAIGLALATEPKLLLLDEPAAGINLGETDRLTALIRKIRDSGVTVCLIEHKMHMVMELAQRIMVLNYGSKIAEGTPEEIKNDEKVIAAYLGGNADA
ncbi:MAG TPA: ABC transporter ATP-binding protein [Clostridia bacterium]|nr:ABC transporter ATP-binding protein [Clostridia bacterium]